MITGVSNISILTQAITGLTNGQATLANLTQQLSSGIRSSDLTDYTGLEARTLVNGRNVQAKAESYIAAGKSVAPRLKLYESTLGALESLINTTVSTIRTTQNAGAAAEQGVKAQIEGTMDQAAYYLNQKVGDRFLYSGTRYTAQPVGDLKTLPVPPAETFPVTNPALPPYDPAAPGSSALAYTRDAVTLDDNLQLTYGIPSTDSAIQNLIQGLRFAYAATQDSGNYDTYMAQAGNLMDQALSGIRSLRTQIAGNQKILAETENGQKTTINLLQEQIDGIRSVDVTEVSAKITSYESQLQASYAATSKLITLTLLDYL
mgnify:CR=1 FL=1